jgi:NTE family protein
MYSTSNLDLLRAEDLDLVVCLNPTSSLHPIRAVDPREWSTLVFRRESGRRLGSEAKKLRAAGTPVVLVQPLERDLQTMSRNLMSTRNRNRVIEVARTTVAEQLRDPAVAELLERLPAGRPEKVSRPDLPPSEWPPLAELQARPAT